MINRGLTAPLFIYGELQMIYITSLSNTAVKEAKLLKNRKYREEKQLYFIEGARFVEEAFEAGAQIEAIFVSEEFRHMDDNLPNMLEKSSCNKYTVSEKIFREISDTETPQGILAIIKMQKRELSVAQTGGGLFIILDSVRDPGNMGTIIRTADAAGFSGVIVCKGSVDVYNPKVLRSTMGSVFHIPVYTGLETVDVIRLLKADGISVYASHLKGEASIYNVDLSANAALVIGSEAEGISNETAGEADRLVRIPMPGNAESLNASVAAAVMIFESVRQRESCMQASDTKKC